MKPWSKGSISVGSISVDGYGKEKHSRKFCGCAYRQQLVSIDVNILLMFSFYLKTLLKTFDCYSRKTIPNM